MNFALNIHPQFSSIPVLSCFSIFLAKRLKLNIERSKKLIFFSSLVKTEHQTNQNSEKIEVPHIYHLEQWDCCLACVLMVLNTVDINDRHIQSLSDLCCPTSIWTVDLAYLLHNFSVSFSYFKVTFGADPNYSVESYYKELIEKVGENLDNSLTNVTDDALSKVLGPDRSHVKGLGFGVTRSKLSMLSQKESRYTAIEDECHKLWSDVAEMKSIISSLLRNQGQTSDQNSNATESQPTIAHTNNPIMPFPLSGNNTSKKCKLVDWSGSGEVVAEGRWSSNDPTVLVHHVPLGPHAYRVWVDVVKKHDAFLWRPSSDISTMEEAIGTTIAWPADKVIMG